jgi:phosphatidate phosphatase APP1
MRANIVLVAGVVALSAGGARADKKAKLDLWDGWGTPTGFVVDGVVAADRGDHVLGASASPVASLIDNAKAIDADGIAGVIVSVVVGGKTYKATTESDGFFEVVARDLPAAEKLLVGDIDASATAHVGEAKLESEAHIAVFPDDKPFVAVVSDIDDTIVHTYVTDKKKMVGAVLLKNGDTSEPIAGAAMAYMKSGAAGFFYVSASPVQFHARLVEFLRAHNFPRGAVLLKRFGHDSITNQESYKMTRLEPLLAQVPTMRVVLVGDTGERDPETYAEVRKKHPDRVAGIIIKKTPKSDVRPERFPDMEIVDDAFPDDAVARFLK